MGTQGTGRKRSTKKERTTAEDDALNLIAREAEARLAAKRAARAEAREIRMKELERQQKEIFQVQKKYYGLNTKVDDRSDSKWGDIEQWMEDSERYSRSSRTQTLSDDDERMSVGSRGSVRSDLDAVGAYGGGDSSLSQKKSKKKKKHKHKDKDGNGNDDDYSVISSRSSRLSDDTRVSRASRLDLQPASYASSDLYSFNGLSSSRNKGSSYNGYQSALYEDSASQRGTGSSSRPLEYTSYRSSGSRVSSRAGSARASPVDNCGSVGSFLRSAASRSGLHRDLDDVTIPDFPDVSRFAHAGGRRCDVEDRDYLEKGSRAASVLTATTLTSLGGTSSRRGSGETAITVDAETSIREIKEIHELKDQIQDVESKYTQNLKQVKDALGEVEEKYRKAMVSNAQLDNEKNNLMYQVDTLKDSLMELEELLSESRRGYEEKVKECEREKHAHTVLQFQFSEMKETLKQSEELLNDIRQLRIKQEGFVREISDLQETVEWKDKKIGALERQKEYTDAIRLERDELREEVVNLKDILKKHGIVLGQDLSINGEGGETEVDGSPSADAASQPAQESRTSPPEGNSMLGNTEETQLRSSGEEEVDPEKNQETFEEAKENHLSFDALCNVAGVSTLETSSEKQPTEEQTCLEEDAEEDNVEERGFSKDLNVDINDQSITEDKDIIVCSPELQGNATSSEENVPETETPEGRELGENSNPDLGETGTKSSSVDTHSDDIRESCDNLFEEQENKLKDVEESQLRNTESCPQQNVAQDVLTESLPDESIPAVSNTEPQQEPEKVEEAENDEAEDVSSKSQPQGAASGKKKKRKRRGKKKGGSHEDKNQQKDGTDKEKGETEVDIASAPRDNGPTAEPESDGSVTETLKESKVDQVKNEEDRQEDGVEAVKCTEIFSPNETLKESRMNHVTDECNKEQALETENMEEAEATTETCSNIETPNKVRVDHVTDEQNKEKSLETVEAVALAETFCHVETLTESRTDPRKAEQDKEHTLETEKVKEVGSITSPVPETNLCTSDLIDDSKGAESTECTSSVDNSKSEMDSATNDNVIHTESEIVDIAQNEVGSVNEMKPECTTVNPEDTFATRGKENTEAVPSNDDIAADEPENKDKTSESPSSTDGFTDALMSSSGSEPSAAVNTGSDDTPIKVSDGGPEEATERVEDDEEPEAATEGLVEPDCSHDEKSNRHDDPSLTKNTDVFDTVKSLLEAEAQAKQPDDVECQTSQCEDQIDESNAEVSSETEEIITIDTPDSPKEATESGSSIKQEHSTEESAAAGDPEHKESQNNQRSEAQQLHGPSKDRSEDIDSCDEEDGEDDEGQSFDFDELDIEAAVATSLPKNQQQEEVEDGVEVTSDESNKESSGLETMPRCNQSSLAQGDAMSEQRGHAQKNMPEETVGAADESRHIVEEGKVQSVGEVAGVVEDINQAMSLPVEEGLDAIKHELQGEDLDSPKSADQVAINKEPQQTGKDVRKNSKKGKGKGKEECKMS
ncbi:leucine-rich repeat flightless-interacting protein 1 isoform X4 [Cottoperca gobio]|uniref:Leucine-rich repeat flightless-interacting protein 1 isoform X4 n=1 Tax=Cottoperca gobio TaxID=56716 RepID=A0A6J2RUF8_COTGO|nr:leucine-rich repeat flightless-interacting protein 1-like isoform X4 [Cottoperca gobio]